MGLQETPAIGRADQTTGVTSSASAPTTAARTGRARRVMRHGQRDGDSASVAASSNARSTVARRIASSLTIRTRSPMRVTPSPPRDAYIEMPAGTPHVSPRVVPPYDTIAARRCGQTPEIARPWRAIDQGRDIHRSLGVAVAFGDEQRACTLSFQTVSRYSRGESSLWMRSTGVPLTKDADTGAVAATSGDDDDGSWDRRADRGFRIRAPRYKLHQCIFYD